MQRAEAVGQLDGDVVLAAPAEQQVEASVGGAHVSHPFAMAARRDEVLAALEVEEIDGHASGLPAAPPPHLEDPAAHDAQPRAGQPAH